MDKIPTPLLADYKLYFNHYLIYLLNGTLEFCMNFFSKAITELVPLDFFRNMGLASAKFIYVLDNHLGFVLFGLLCAYSMIGIFMATLLIFDKQLTLKKSLSIAFKSINRHLVRNIILILLASLGFVSISMISLWIGVISFWIGLIWLMPMISLVTAIQYEQIFCEGKLI